MSHIHDGMLIYSAWKVKSSFNAICGIWYWLKTKVKLFMLIDLLKKWLDFTLEGTSILNFIIREAKQEYSQPFKEKVRFRDFSRRFLFHEFSCEITSDTPKIGEESKLVGFKTLIFVRNCFEKQYASKIGQLLLCVGWSLVII